MATDPTQLLALLRARQAAGATPTSAVPPMAVPQGTAAPLPTTAPGATPGTPQAMLPQLLARLSPQQLAVIMQLLRLLQPGGGPTPLGPTTPGAAPTTVPTSTDIAGGPVRGGR